MNSETFRKIEEIYHDALELPQEKRSLFVENSCDGNIEMRKEVEALLSFEESDDSFIDSTPAGLASEMFSKEEKTETLINRNIGRYKVQKTLGEGGMGTVYLAQDNSLARPVALKVLSPEMVRHEDRVQRFMHEARSASALNHPHILTVYEIDEWSSDDFEKIHFISMEFVDGKTLDELIYKTDTSTNDLLKYLSQAAKGISKAHDAGIVHRDLKPENIMVSNDGYAKVLDFGLAKLTDTEHELHKLQKHKSRSGLILGTLGYMSPEQAQGKADIDERSDIFSFGCILYEAITKLRAFEADTTIDALHKIVYSEPPPITDFVPSASAELVGLIDGCLKKAPEDRLSDIAEIAATLERLLTDGSDFGRLSNPQNEQKTVILDQAATNPTISKQFSEQRRQVTVMFADFSAIAEILEDSDPELSSGLMKSLWELLDDLIVNNGGRIGERLAETFVAIWGTGSSRESDPEGAVRTALELQKQVSSYFNKSISKQIDLAEIDKEELNLSKFLKVGISTGTVLLGNSKGTGEFITSGSAVNVAKRLLSNSKVGEIFVSHATYRNIRGIFEVQEVDAKSGHTKARAKIYSIKGIKPRAFRLESRGVEGIETQMFGREGELIRMRDALDCVIEDKELQVVTIVGEAGLGKSRLLFEFQDEIELLPEKYFVFKSRALETMRGLPYSLIRDLFLYQFEILEKDPQTTARENFVRGIVALLAESSDKFGSNEEIEMKSHFIGHLIGLDFSSSPHIKGIFDDEKQIQDRSVIYAAQFFSVVSQKYPAIFYLDDLHWADDESLDFIELISQKCSDQAILIAQFTRPGLFERRPHWGEGKENHRILDLHPLTKRDSRKLIKNILRKTEGVPEQLRDLLVSNAEGNPFYVEELIKMLIEQGAITTNGEKWTTDADRLGGITVPPTLTGVLQSRLDKLSPSEKSVLQRASVIGREFWDDALEDFQPGINLKTILESLRNKEFLFRKEHSSLADTNEYIFKHALLRDVTYETILLEDRKRWHSDTAAWLIKKESERENEYLSIIADHFEKAGEIEHAALWYGKAGMQAIKSYALKLAEVYLDKALRFWSLVSDNQENTFLELDRVLKWKHGLAKAYFEQARFLEAIDTFTGQLEMAKAADDKLSQAYAYWGLSFSQFDSGDTKSSLENAKETVRLASGVGLDSSDEARFLRSSGLYRQGRALVALGEFDDAISIAEEALEISKNLGGAYSRAIPNCFHLLASANLFLGRLDKAREFEQREVEISREIGDRRTLGNGLNSLGFQSYVQGEGEQAIEYYNEAFEIAGETGNETGRIMVRSNIGGAKVFLGEYESAEFELKALIEGVGDEGHFLIPETYRFLTESLIGQGKFEEALSKAKMSLQLSEKSENQETVGEAWRVLGVISSSMNRKIPVDEQELSASECFEKSLGIFEEIKMEVNCAQTLHNFSQHLLAHGEPEKAVEMSKREKEISNRLNINTAAKSPYFVN